MSLRRAALESIRDTLFPLVQTAKPATIISAPPSKPAEYPAMALLLDRFQIHWSNSWELQVDSSGKPLVGTNLSLNSVPANVAMVDGNRTLTRMGSMQGSGRIWVAARHAAKREEMEEAVLEAFSQDGSAPGRLLATMQGVKMRDFTIPWAWTVAAIIDEDAEWRDEYAFSERLWSFVRFKLDTDLLVPRNDPRIKNFVLSYDISALENTDSANDPDLDDSISLQLSGSGDLVPYP